MKAYLIRRLLLVVPTLIGISLISFCVIQLASGSPVTLRLMKLQGAMASDSVPDEVIEKTKALYGLDKPIPLQYLAWLKRLATLDFGTSYKDHRPVLEKIGETLPITLQLNIISIFLVYVISIPLGVFSATRPGTRTDTALTVFLFILYSLPSFWVAMLLLYFLGNDNYLNWFPVYGLNSMGAEELSPFRWLLDRAWHLVLPVFCLTYGGLAGLSRYARAGLVDVIRQDYIRTARAYGFSEKTIVFKYAMRNSLIPIITLLGTLLPALLGGSVIIESIFSIPGMGRLGFEAILSRDYPLVMGNTHRIRVSYAHRAHSVRYHVRPHRPQDPIRMSEPVAENPPLQAVRKKSQGYWRLVARQFAKRPRAVVSLIILVALGIIALFAPFLAGEKPIYLALDGKTYWFPNIIKHKDLVSFDFSRWDPADADRVVLPLIHHAPERSNLRNKLAAPSAEHWLGTDDRGRDVLSRLIWGARVSMSIGFVAVGIAIVIGVILGALAGYYGGWVDIVVLRVIEIVLTFPAFFLILSVMAFLPPNIYSVMIVLGLLGWTGIARLVRAEFLRLRGSDFATAARATGLKDKRVIFRHLLPNALSPVWVSATFGVAGAILTESALSFLGFGVPPPTASWGEILSQSRDYLYRGVWWLVVYPGLAIFVTVTAFNLVGDGLRDAMDPRLRE